MISQNMDSGFEKPKEVIENEESVAQFSNPEPIKDYSWTDESRDVNLADDNLPVEDSAAETLNKGTPSWASIPEEDSVENMNNNSDLEEMDEIHELDELNRLDDLDEINKPEEVNEEYKVDSALSPIVSLSALTSPNTALLNGEETENYLKRWSKIQGNFVDDPKATLKEADSLVSELIEEIKRKLTDELIATGSQWKQGSEITTEDLRITLQHYRSIFNRSIGKN